MTQYAVISLGKMDSCVFCFCKNQQTNLIFLHKRKCMQWWKSSSMLHIMQTYNKCHTLHFWKTFCTHVL